MDHHIERAPEALPSRRRVLRLTAGLLGAGGTVTLGAARAPARPGHPDDACTGGYDAGYEADLAEADARYPRDRPYEDHRAPEVPPGQAALPLRRVFRVTARYGVPGDWLAGHHTGIDLAVPQGTPVYAVGAGVVVLARWSGAYGNAVTVRMPDGHFALYAHLSLIETREGANIETGARIASSGATGRATGPHLHLEVRTRRTYGSDVDPVGYLAKRGARLL
ncbi:M23 family metallopeptidase [Streptomyces flavofungini]|uniref:M23 family metallopeptidase n=1 Tax=Streptomyces flavofungini TaxID=68200 RepID=UPI0034DF600B